MFTNIQRPHIETTRAADHTKSRDYCKKEEGRIHGPWEGGDFRSTVATGKRTDLDTIVKEINEGKTIKEVAEAHGSTYIRNYRGIQHYAELTRPSKKRDMAQPVNIWVYQGVTGSGKSRRARTLCGERVYLKSPEAWWCGYDSNKHDYVLFEEFEGPDWLPPATLLQILDRYPCNVVMRGRESYPMACINFVFTSNTGVKNWYKGTKYYDVWYQEDWEGNIKQDCKLAAFMRRIREGTGDCHYFDKHWDDQDETEQAIL